MAPTPKSTSKFGIFWDIENCSAGDISLAAIRIPYFDGVPLIDIPDKEPNSADRVIMSNMFAFAFATRPSSYIMLLSGDGDFCNAFESLGKLGYTTLLVFPTDGASQGR
ncbi:chromo domain protein LHP1 [Tanacetum coccineum]